MVDFHSWVVGLTDPMHIDLETGLSETREITLRAHHVEGQGKHLHVIGEHDKVIGIFNDWLYYYRADLVE